MHVGRRRHVTGQVFVGPSNRRPAIRLKGPPFGDADPLYRDRRRSLGKLAVGLMFAVATVVLYCSCYVAAGRNAVYGAVRGPRVAAAHRTFPSAVFVVAYYPVGWLECHWFNRYVTLKSPNYRVDFD